jgi:signal transduction histidine kinase
VRTVVASAPSRALADRSWATPLIIGLPVCLLVTLLIPFDGLLHPGQAFGDFGQLFAVGAIAAIAVAATVCVLHWRIRADAGLPLLAVALVLTAVRLGLRHGAPAIDGHGDIEEAASTALLGIVVALVLVAVRRGGTTRADPWRLAHVALVVAAVGTAVTLVADIAVEPMPRGDTLDLAGALVPLAAWLIVAIVALGAALSDRRQQVYAGVAFFAVAISLHKVVALVQVLLGHTPSESHLAFVLVGGGILAAAALTDLRWELTAQREEIESSYAVAATAVEEVGRLREQAEERVHEARNALLAIEGAVRTLERNIAGLSPEDRDGLSRGAITELRRLQHLIDVVPRPAEAVSVAVRDAIETAVTTARISGLDVVATVPHGLRVEMPAADLGGVMHNLLVNVIRHAPGSSAVVTARSSDDVVLLDIADRGPGVPQEARRWIFERSARGGDPSRSDGSGLGLYIARRTVREHGGDLRHLPRDGGGSVFRLVLPVGH